MRISNLRPVASPSGSSGVVAVFDLRLPSIQLNGLLLRRNRVGDLRVASPNLRGGHVAHFAPEFAEQITAAAVAALNGGPKPDASQAA